MIGGFIVEGWNEAWPGGGPFGLVGWQAAFMAVGIQGLLLAAWVAPLKEPVRGLVDGVPTEPSPTPFKGFFEELYATIPPFTLLSDLSRGGRALASNIGAAVLLKLGALEMNRLTGAALQWWCKIGRAHV